MSKGKSKAVLPVTKTRIPITARALVQRVRRALAKEGGRLLVNRGRQHLGYGGVYYVVDQNRNVTTVDVDLETVGKELGVLHPWERVVADED